MCTTRLARSAVARPRLRAAWASSLLVALAACDVPPTPAVPRASVVAPPHLGASDARAGPPSSRLARLQFEVSGRAFQLPVVTGTVGGVRTLLLVDTGASANMVTGWIARQAKLPLSSHGDTGRDHVGKTVTTARTSRPSLAVDGWGALPDRETLVVEVPAALERLGIGAFLSPQRLDAAAVVLDLPRGELREGRDLGDEKGALAEWASLSRPEARGLPEARVCLDRASLVGGLAFVLPARLRPPGGSPPREAELLVDTGAQRTNLLTTSPAGRALSPGSEPGESVFAASGTITTRRLRGVDLEIGDVRARLDVELLPGSTHPSCPRDGVLGMDVLRRCVLVFGQPPGGPPSLHARCLVDDLR